MRRDFPTLADGDYFEKNEAKRDSELQDAFAIQLEATHRHFDRKVSGSPAMVLPDIDARDLRALTVTFGKAYLSNEYSLALAFDRTDGVSVRLAAPSADWLVIAREKLPRVLRPNRPIYWPLRDGRVILPAVIVVELLLLGSLLAAAPPKNIGDGFLLGLSVATPAALIVWGVYALMRRVLPAFELVPDGRRARGARIVSVVVAVAAWIGGIVLPFFLFR